MTHLTSDEKTILNQRSELLVSAHQLINSLCQVPDDYAKPQTAMTCALLKQLSQPASYRLAIESCGLVNHIRALESSLREKLQTLHYRMEGYRHQRKKIALLACVTTGSFY